MAAEKSQDDEIAAYKASLPASFFSDATATEERKKVERVRGRTAGERVRAKERTRERTVHIGIRTTPDVRALIQTLTTRLALNTATEVIEHALRELDRNSKKRA